MNCIKCKREFEELQDGLCLACYIYKNEIEKNYFEDGKLKGKKLKWQK